MNDETPSLPKELQKLMSKTDEKALTHEQNSSVRSAYSGSIDAVRDPHVKAALHAEVSARLAVYGAQAIEILAKLAKDPTASHKVRLDAARDLASRAGYLPPKAGGSGAKTPSEMTAAELQEQIRRLQQEAGNRAKTVQADAQEPEK